MSSHLLMAHRSLVLTLVSTQKRSPNVVRRTLQVERLKKNIKWYGKTFYSIDPECVEKKMCTFRPVLHCLQNDLNLSASLRYIAFGAVYK